MDRWIQMLPHPPLPDFFATGRHLEQVIGVDCALGFRDGDAAIDLLDDVIGQRRRAHQQRVAVPQQPAIVMVIGLSDFPQNVTVPVDFQRDATLEGLLAQEGLVRNFAVVEQRAFIGQVPVQTWWVRHVPRVDDGAFHVDQHHEAATGDRREQRVARRDARWVVAAEPRPPALDGVGLDDWLHAVDACATAGRLPETCA